MLLETGAGFPLLSGGLLGVGPELSRLAGWAWARLEAVKELTQLHAWLLGTRF